MVDVLNYFCCVRKEEHRKAACLVPAGRKDTVILPLHEWYVKVMLVYHGDFSEISIKSSYVFDSFSSFKPIHRLGETYSMSRIRRPPGKKFLYFS